MAGRGGVLYSLEGNVFKRYAWGLGKMTKFQTEVHGLLSVAKPNIGQNYISEKYQHLEGLTRHHSMSMQRDLANR